VATYDKQVWPDATRTDSLGARLNHMEQGIYDASLNAEGGGVTICTSTTRPASPVAGQIIFETDTDKTYVFAEGVWQQVSASGAPTGAAGGVLSGTYPNPGFASLGSNVTTLPVGTIIPFAGATAPAGWLFCFGQNVSRTTYADLYATVTNSGATFPYGSGDGSTTFGLPDLRGRVPAGKDDMGGTAASRLTSGGAGITGTTLGASGGAETHTLTTAQMPAHGHTFSVTGTVDGGAAANFGSNYTVGARTTFSGTTANAGGGGAHPITQPTIVTNYIIKAVADAVTSLAVSLSGSAGGVLAGSYPNPSFAPITNTCVTQPVGTINPYAGSDATVPAGWLFCGGQAVSRSTYADLFAVVSTTYGAGDGSTTFNVPDLRGRVLAGKDDMGGTAASRLTAAGSGITGTTLGAAGGTQTHTLTTAQMPSHSHQFIPKYGGSAGTGVNMASPSFGNAYGLDTSYIGATGGDGAHQNTQPTIVTNYIIKALADTTSSIAVAIAGAAGGDLAGSYPNPTFASSIATNLKVANASPTITIAETGGTGQAALQLLQNGLPLSSEGSELRYDSATGHTYLRSSYSGGNLYLGAGSSSAAQTFIDASGRFSTPNHPGFFVYNSASIGRGASDQSAIVWGNAVYNTGSCYNTSNGRFTAPVSGYYMFCANIRTDGGASGSYMRWGIKKNNAGQGWESPYGNAHAIFGGTHPTDYITLPVNTVIYLAANDYVWAWTFHVASGSTVVANESSFSGYFLG